MRNVINLPCFEIVDKEVKNRLAKLNNLGIACLAILAISKKKFNIDGLSINEIVLVAEKLGLSLTDRQVIDAMYRAGIKVKKVLENGEHIYKIMTLGENEVIDLIDEENPTIFFIEGDKPCIARKKIEEIFNSLVGEIIICDPYFGLRTVDIIALLNQQLIIRFLSTNFDNHNNQLNRMLTDFKKEFPKFEIRVYPKSQELHDRYLISDNYLLIFGHGFKDIGTKESFIICLKREFVEDMVNEIITKFEERWKQAVKK